MGCMQDKVPLGSEPFWSFALARSHASFRRTEWTIKKSIVDSWSRIIWTYSFLPRRVLNLKSRRHSLRICFSLFGILKKYHRYHKFYLRLFSISSPFSRFLANPSISQRIIAFSHNQRVAQHDSFIFLSFSSCLRKVFIIEYHNRRD